MKSWTLRTLLLTLIATFATTLSLNAQSAPTKTGGDSQQTPQQSLKPQMSVSDIAFTLNTLASVNINGSEVEAYIDVKNTFVKVFEQAQKDKKTETDVVTFELSVLTANNFLQLFQRANLTGAAAEKFMNVKNALYASAPKAPGTTPSTGQK